MTDFIDGKSKQGKHMFILSAHEFTLKLETKPAGFWSCAK